MQKLVWILLVGLAIPLPSIFAEENSDNVTALTLPPGESVTLGPEESLTVGNVNLPEIDHGNPGASTQVGSTNSIAFNSGTIKNLGTLIIPASNPPTPPAAAPEIAPAPPPPVQEQPPQTAATVAVDAATDKIQDHIATLTEAQIPVIEPPSVSVSPAADPGAQRDADIDHALGVS